MPNNVKYLELVSGLEVRVGFICSLSCEYFFVLMARFLHLSKSVDNSEKEREISARSPFNLYNLNRSLKCRVC